MKKDTDPHNYLVLHEVSFNGHTRMPEAMGWTRAIYMPTLVMASGLDICRNKRGRIAGYYSHWCMHFTTPGISVPEGENTFSREPITRRTLCMVMKSALERINIKSHTPRAQRFWRLVSHQTGRVCIVRLRLRALFAGPDAVQDLLGDNR